MQGGYLDVEAQLLSHPNIRRRAFGGTIANLYLWGDSYLTWKMADTGSTLERIWNCHWNTPPEHHFWIYEQLRAGNVDAIYQLGPGTGLNIGELYLALYAARSDHVAFLVMNTRTGRRLGADTGWRPIELRGALYDYAVSRFSFF